MPNSSSALTIDDEVFCHNLTPLIDKWRAEKDEQKKGKRKKPKEKPFYE